MQYVCANDMYIYRNYVRFGIMLMHMFPFTTAYMNHSLICRSNVMPYRAYVFEASVYVDIHIRLSEYIVI